MEEGDKSEDMRKNQTVVENKKEEEEKDLTVVRREKEVEAVEGKSGDGVKDMVGKRRHQLINYLP